MSDPKQAEEATIADASAPEVQAEPSDETAAAGEATDGPHAVEPSAPSAETPESEDAQQSAIAEVTAVADEGFSIEEKRNRVRAEILDRFDLLDQRFDDISEPIRDLDRFVRAAKDVLFREAEEYRDEGRKPLLESLFHIHDLLFRQVQAMESGEGKPNAFVLNLFETVEGEFKRNGIDVIRPHPGEAPDPTIMSLTGAVKCSFWRKDGTISRVHRCGFRKHDGQMLRIAAVDVYRRQGV